MHGKNIVNVKKKKDQGRKRGAGPESWGLITGLTSDSHPKVKEKKKTERLGGPPKKRGSTPMQRRIHHKPRGP